MKYHDFILNIFSLQSDNKSNRFADTFENNQYFRKNFSCRILNLYNLYKSTNFEKPILNKLKELTNPKNWQGAYAELLAYDILNSDNWGLIEIDKKIDDENFTFAHEYGKKLADLDGYFSDLEVYFDVKSLQDNKFLDKVIKDAKKNSKNKCSILAQYDIDDDFDEYNNKFADLVDELTNALDNKLVKFDSNIIPNLSYNIHYENGTNSSLNSYNPYRNAENFTDTFLKRYSCKFVKDRPFFLIIVNSWLYNSINNNCFDGNKIFYRSLSRRLFMQYRHSDKKMKEIFNEFKGEQTVFEVSKKLSGIIFIDDLPINNDDIKCYIYINPNADNKCPLFVDNHLYDLQCKKEIDNFIFDNY